ncbi:alpha/beta hydrolase [uncultured Flavobacterium sp.]|uniref:alpha/beta hydrolase n=1 Tax=uncultured Flavobacterium sp. TaxID=165435 RepID=UPI0030CA4ED4
MTQISSKKNKAIEIPKMIIYTGKILQFLSSSLTVKFVVKLFTTPIKYKAPKREFEMKKNSIQELFMIPALNKKINVYHYGKGEKKALIVHGWSGRGTQMYKIADALIDKGYSVLSFDAPAHGKSESKTSLMPEFMKSILELDKKFGPFEVTIGHSIGGVAILNASKRGFKTNKIITIGAADKISDIAIEFIKQLQLKQSITPKLIHYFESTLNQKMSDYDSFHAIQNLECPLLLIHDKNDDEVPFYCAENIHKHSKNSVLFATNHLGHRKILASEVVINEILRFLN